MSLFIPKTCESPWSGQYKIKRGAAGRRQMNYYSDSKHNGMSRFRTQQHATIQNICDSEYDSMQLSEHNGVPQQKLVTFMLRDSTASLWCCCKFSLLEQYVMSTVKQFPVLWRTVVPSPSWSSSLLRLLNPSSSGPRSL